MGLGEGEMIKVILPPPLAGPLCAQFNFKNCKNSKVRGPYTFVLQTLKISNISILTIPYFCIAASLTAPHLTAIEKWRP